MLRVRFSQNRSTRNGKIRNSAIPVGPLPISDALPFQVAAVCYRVIGPEPQFLLVKTSSGKWTFPKGAADPTLLPCRVAEQEAMEEAGAIGRSAEEHFHTYLYGKGVFWKNGGVQEWPVRAFLLEISNQCAPMESGRDPLWCTADEAKLLLSFRRERKYAAESDRLVDLAVESINRSLARHSRRLKVAR